MKISTIARPVRVAAACLVLVGSLAACGGGCSKEGDAASSVGAESSLVEELANGVVAWTIGADGKVRAEVSDKDGKSVTKDATGTLAWETESGKRETVKLAYDEDAKALVAAGPKPTRDITELEYDIEAPPGALAGTLYVPVGGTVALVEDSKASEKAPAQATGPNGGVVQVVGDDRVEIVADDEGDEVRVYILDADGKAVAAGDRKVTLAVNAGSSDVVVLAPSADGAYLTGKWKAADDPSRVTVVVRRGTVAHVAIVGWKPGTKLVVAGGPKVKVKKRGLGWGAGGKPVDLRGKEGAGVTPGGAVVKVGLEPKGGKGDDVKKGPGGKGEGNGKAKGGGNGKGGGKGK